MFRQSLPLPRYVVPKILRSSERVSKPPQKFSRICLYMILPRASPPPPLSLFNKLQSDVHLATLLNVPIMTQTLISYHCTHSDARCQYESAVVEDVLLSVFVTRIYVFDALKFDGTHLLFWFLYRIASENRADGFISRTHIIPFLTP